MNNVQVNMLSIRHFPAIHIYNNSAGQNLIFVQIFCQRQNRLNTVLRVINA